MKTSPTLQVLIKIAMEIDEEIKRLEDFNPLDNFKNIMNLKKLSAMVMAAIAGDMK